MNVVIEQFASKPRSDADLRALDQIFFAASSVQQFGDEAERVAFRERWLGRYLLADATHAFVAVEVNGRIVGYVIGSVADIAGQARFADLASARQFASVSARYPAHLHINIDEAYRSHGIGARLIETFAAHAQAQGAPGMHVVTGGASRNVRFYARNGFREAGRIPSAGGDKVFLARDFLGGPDAAIKA